ncbi:MAG: serpin family protein [Lachnospiraceae bacterium]|nr:serpin family protein [Lachnospiraceae bacterium]
MVKHKERILAYLLVASMTAVSGGCQKPAVSIAEANGSRETSVEETGTLTEKGEESMGQKSGKRGVTREAKEPEKAAISPDDFEGWSKLLNENEISEAFEKGMKEFAYKSGSAVLKEEQGNGNYSPLSLYYTLALAGCGATGETAEQILENLGIENQEELADQCRRLYQWYVYQTQRDQERMEQYGMKDYKSAISLGNSLWISDQLTINETYSNLAAEKFFASSYSVDFGNPDTGKEMGTWIGKKTNGVLKPQLSPDPGTLLAILNTLYFYGGWAEPFSPEMTKEDGFTLENGSKVTVPFLNRTEMMGAFKKGDGYTMSYLGTNNNCRMMFLLPDEGRSVGEFLENPDILKEVMETEEDEWVQGKVVWKIPKFNFGSSYKLEDTMQGMGMNKMFDSGAEFGGISPEPLMVSSIIQETHIGVDEQGVEGAAYTMIAMARGALLDNGQMAEMILDRPFLFGIQDNAHNVWLFLGVCRNPSEENKDHSLAKMGKEDGNLSLDNLAAENDLLLNSAPEIELKDQLSSTMKTFPVKSGNFSWGWKEGDEIIEMVACGNHPLDIDLKNTDRLEIPNYNGMEEVSYGIQCVVMPERVTVREWDISQLGDTQIAEPKEVDYSQQVILLKPDKVYEITAEWPKENLEKNGFFGEASYVVITD